MSNSRKNRSSSTDKPAARATTEELAKATGQVTEEQPAKEEQPAPATEEQPAVGTEEQAAAPAAPATEEQAPQSTEPPKPAPLADQHIEAWGRAADGRSVLLILDVVNGQFAHNHVVHEVAAVAPGTDEMVAKGIQFARELISKGEQGSKVHLVRKVALFGEAKLARKQVLQVINAVNEELAKKVGGTVIAPATVFTQFQYARKTGKA